MKLQAIKRIAMDLTALMLIVFIAVVAPASLFPESATVGLLSLMASKMLFISAGIVHAHISRKLLFPYIDFRTERRWDNNVMIIAWYVVIIWGWARGG